MNEINEWNGMEQMDGWMDEKDSPKMCRVIKPKDESIVGIRKGSCEVKPRSESPIFKGWMAQMWSNGALCKAHG
jgi:hypothetical protein